MGKTIYSGSSQSAKLKFVRIFDDFSAVKKIIKFQIKFNISFIIFFSERIKHFFLKIVGAIL